MKTKHDAATDTDFQIRVRKIKNGMIVLRNGETTYCKDMDAVQSVMDDEFGAHVFSVWDFKDIEEGN